MSAPYVSDRLSITEQGDGRAQVTAHNAGVAYVPVFERAAAAAALAGDQWRVVGKDLYDKLTAENERLKAAQPDRPEPVDPWDVATGDVVDYERLPSFKTCRVVGEVQETFSEQDTSWSLRIHGSWWNASPDVATVRVLRRAEPEPDPAVVEAWRVWLRGKGCADETYCPDVIARGLALAGVTAPEVNHDE